MGLNDILIADSQMLTSEGISSVIKNIGHYNNISIAETYSELFNSLENNTPSILIIDPNKVNDFSIANLTRLTEVYPTSRILVLTGNSNKEFIIRILESGITHLILKNCTKQELLNALTSIEKQEKFLCKEAIEALLKENISPAKANDDHLTKKEFEIISLLVQGLTTKEIATNKFLSVHTVNTHRKNILKKLGLNNTSEIIMYAIRTGIVDTTEYYI